MYSMEYDRQTVHAQLSEEFDEDAYEEMLNHGRELFAEEYFYSCLVPILDENDNPIPIDKCICGAYNPSECGCQTTCWDDYNYNEGDY